jgi:hypothetical protein
MLALKKQGRESVNQVSNLSETETIWHDLATENPLNFLHRKASATRRARYDILEFMRRVV